MNRPRALAPVFVRLSAVVALAAIPASAAGVRPAAAAPPGEVGGLAIAASVLAWDPVPGADDYNVYRGLTSWLVPRAGAQCHGDEITATSFDTQANPDAGRAFYYLVTAESNAGGEGTVGTDSVGASRVLRGSCDAVMRHHILDRLGYGWDEWTRDRILALGPQGYIDAQIDPATIDESTNTELNSRKINLVPPENLQELQALDLVTAVYARRQLEQQATLFWDNHFNTDFRESFEFFGFYQNLFPLLQASEAVKLHYNVQNDFRNLAFNGTFREIVEASALSPAMILYLDTDTNVKGVPNENFARELLELHSLGVDGGYTQKDVEELARVFTGWNVCKKDAAVADDPLAVCIPRSTYGTPSEPPGLWVRNFRINQHDTGQKILFQGTPHQAIIPDTTANPSNGIDDVSLALDAIVGHPSAPAFIARKLLQRFVDDNPTQAMIDAVVKEWNDAGNPRGIGDLREVLRAALALQAFRSPASAGNKIKTPFEHVASALRAVRGKTDGIIITRTYITRMQELFHSNPVPTGYPELGGDWLDTNNLLERQNFGLDLTARTGTNFGADVIGLLNANGVSTAPSPNNAPAIVDFLAESLFGGALAPAERQAAIDYLNTDDNGVPSAYNDSRIRETAGFLMGYAQFLEQ